MLVNADTDFIGLKQDENDIFEKPGTWQMVNLCHALQTLAHKLQRNISKNPIVKAVIGLIELKLLLQIIYRQTWIIFEGVWFPTDRRTLYIIVLRNVALLCAKKASLETYQELLSKRK